MPFYSLTKVEIQALHLAFTGEDGGWGGHNFSVVLAGVEWFLSKVFCLARLLLSQSFGKREQTLLGAFFFLALIGISKLPTSLVSNLEVKKKTQRTHHCIVSCSLRSLVCLSSPNFLSLLMFILMSRVFICTQQKKQGKIYLLNLSGRSSPRSVLTLAIYGSLILEPYRVSLDSAPQWCLVAERQSSTNGDSALTAV